MSTDNAPEAASDEADPLIRFRNWRGFLAAAVIVNILFVYGMLGHQTTGALAIWYKTLIWLPFNVIATVLYYVFKIKLAGQPGGAYFGALCLVMVTANWIAMFAI